ncbi:TPA: hypothetical protein ACX6Q6_003537 [Photobacterium damselae]
MSYFLWLMLYILASVSSQFLTTQPINLFSLGNYNIWMPLSALTVVPLVDVLRCFTQYQSEKESRSPRTTMYQMLGLSTLAAGACVFFAGLPIPIFSGVLAAVTAGCFTDFLAFRAMGLITKHPVKRMVVSNLITTLVGSGLVFFIAFTDLVFPASQLTKPLDHVVVGWLSQSVFIWIAGLIIASIINKVLPKK